MIVLAFAAALTLSAPQDTIRMTLEEALTNARRSSPGFIRETLNRSNDELSWLEARAERFLPEIGLEVTTPEYVSALRRVSNPDGSDRFVKTLRRTLEAELELSQPLPTGGTFSISGTITSLNQPNDDPEERFQGNTFLGFQITQDFFGINNRRRSYRLARESHVRAQTEFLDSERDLANDVIEEYYDLVQAIKEAQIDSVLFVRDSLRSMESRPGATLVDSLKFAREVALSALSRTQSRQELARQRASFNETFGLPRTAVIIPDTVVRFERIEVDEQAGLEFALQNRLDLKLSELSVENRRASLRDARKTSPITVELDGTVGFDGAAEDFTMSPALRAAIREQERSTSIQLRVSVPLFDRFEERYAVREASNDLRMSELSLEEQLRELENEVHLTAEDVANAIALLQLAEANYNITRQTLAIQTTAFAQGEITLSEFLIDQANAREAEVELLEAQVDVLTANEEWKRVIGIPPFSDPAPPPSATGSPNGARPAPRTPGLLPRFLRRR